jgi:dihydropyrimidinase
MGGREAMSDSTLVVRGGTIVSGEMGVFKSDLLIRNGKIAELSLRANPGRDVEVLDASDLFVFPGFIDTHMHLGNYLPFEDDCETESRAAASGGVTTVLTFCKVLRHRTKQVSYLDILDEVAELINRLSTVDVGLHCVVGTDQHMDEAAACVRRGVVSFKFYMAYRNDPQALARGTVGLDDGKIFRGYQRVGQAGPSAIAMTHCENDDIIKELLSEGRHETFSFDAWERAHPMFAEAEAIERALRMAVAAKCPLFIVHMGSAGLEVVRRFRRETGHRIAVETTPHYLCLTPGYCAQLSEPAIAKTAPPVRNSAEVDALWQGVRDGTVDTIGTDHCASSTAQQPGFGTGGMGFASVELYPALLVTEGRKRGIPLERLAAITSLNPARIFDLYPRKGSIRPGADADLALMDLSAPWTFRASQSVSTAKFSPYDGWQLTARTRATVLRGHVIYKDGEFAAERHGVALIR